MESGGLEEDIAHILRPYPGGHGVCFEGLVREGLAIDDGFGIERQWQVNDGCLNPAGTCDICARAQDDAAVNQPKLAGLKTAGAKLFSGERGVAGYGTSPTNGIRSALCARRRRSCPEAGSNRW